MKWLKALMNRIFRKQTMELIGSTGRDILDIKEKNEFKVMIKKKADLDCNDGNGYKIATNFRLKDMV